MLFWGTWLMPFYCFFSEPYHSYHSKITLCVRLAESRVIHTWTMTPPTATAVEAGDCSHCRGLEWGFLLRLRVQPMHRLRIMYSMDTWDTISQTAPRTDSTEEEGTIIFGPVKNDWWLSEGRWIYILPGCPSQGYQHHLWNTCRTQGRGHATRRTYTTLSYLIYRILHMIVQTLLL